MSLDQWLNHAVNVLSNVVGTARLDAELLASHVLQRSRPWLLAHVNEALTSTQQTALNSLLARRYRHEPMAYILGRQEFYGRVFFVDKHVLVPRPESERMIEIFLSYLPASHFPLHVVDVGTGSGALIITAALELAQTSNLKPQSSFYAVDIDAKCLDVARKNAHRYSVDVTFLQGDLLSPLHSSFFPLPSSLMILANLPYVPDSHTVNESALIEPKLAIFGGQDGLDQYRRLFSQLADLRAPSSEILVFTESLPFQHNTLREIAQYHHFRETMSADFIQLFEL